MKRRMTLWMIGTLLSLLPTMASSPDSLVFKKVLLVDQAYANVPMAILVDVTNTSTEDYYGLWSVGEEPDWRHYQFVEIKGGETVEFYFESIIYKTGDFQFSVFDLGNEQPLYTFPVHVKSVDIKVEGSVEVNTDLDEEGHRIIYTDFYKNIRIGGTVSFTNVSDTPIITQPIGIIGVRKSLIQVVLDPQIEGQNGNTIYNMRDEINVGETFSGDYSILITDSPVEGQEYTVQLKYLDKVLATSEPFTFSRGTNTYWIKGGSRKNLPVVDGVLKVPGDALAVDIRGLYEMDTVYSIDVSEANPNCLYYLGFLDNVPKGFESEANVVRDGDASMVTIDSNYDYYCPVSFSAKSALFTYTPISESRGPASPIMSQRMSAMIILPFTAQKAWLSGTNEYHEDYPFYNEDFKMAILDSVEEDGTLVFQPFSHYNPAPYNQFLIYDIKPSPIIFYSENVDIPSINIVKDVLCNTIYRYGSKSTREAEKYTYSWNCDKNCFCLNEEGAIIRPFNVTVGKWDNSSGTCVDTGLDVLPHYIKPFNPSGIESVTKSVDNSSQQLTVFSLSGQAVGTATYVDGRLKAEGLKPGLYVAGGRKIVIK